MADYAIWGSACEPAYTKPGNLMKALALARTESVEDVIEASVAAQVLREHLRKVAGTEWRTTAGAMYAALKATAIEMEVAKSDRWPADGQRLMRELTNVAPALREVGIEVRRGKREGRERTRTLVVTHPGAGKTASAASAAFQNSDFNDLDADPTEDADSLADASVRASVQNKLLNGEEKTSADAADAHSPTEGCRGNRYDGLAANRRPPVGPEGDSLDEFNP